MADANQLKIQARREEAAGDYTQASRLYRRALSAMEAENDLPDPSLLVRVADLEYRKDDSESALRYYRRAVDEYAEQGLITNAIAVCNKILRVYPDCVDCYRRLADLHLDVGLSAEARQNLMEYADRAWDPDAPEDVLGAVRAFLDRTADPDVAVRLATLLERLDRTDDAIGVLREVWEARTGADADVKALERKARELRPDLDPGEWAAGGDEDLAGRDAVTPDEEMELPASAGPPGGGGEAEEGDGTAWWNPSRLFGEGPFEVPAEEVPTGEPSPAEAAGEEVGAGEETGGRRSDVERPASAGRVPEGGGDRARLDTLEDDLELELVASYRERFTEIAARRPADGRSPAPTPPPQWEEHVMDESDRGSETATRGTSWWERDEPDAAEEESPGGASGAAPPHGGAPEGTSPGAGGGRPAERGMSGLDERTPPSPGAGEDELGEEAELRRGLQLVDDMLEVQPDSLNLRERKVRYARRLGDRDTLVDAYLDLAERLAQEGSRRSARSVYREVLDLDPGNEGAEAGLARLDVGELEDKRQSGKRAGADRGTPEASTAREQEARRELGMRLWTEFENSIREMPWLHAATQAYQATGPESLPPLEAFEMLAHYLMARGRHRDAAEILSRALDLAGDEDESMADVLYHLGVAHEKLGEEGRAEEYFRRLEAVDPEFSRVRSTLTDTETGTGP